MTGRPLRAQVLARIDQAGGWRALAERYASEPDANWRTLAESLGCSRSYLYQLIDEAAASEAGGEGARHLAHARRQRGGLLAEQALEIADDTPADKDMVALSKLRIDTRLRLAAAHDPEAYGQQSKMAGGVTVNIGQLHLSALRARPTRALASLAGAENAAEVAELAPGEVIEHALELADLI